MEGRKSDAQKRRKRRRRFRRAAQQVRTGARARSRAGELVVGTYNVRTGMNGIGHAEVILKTCEDEGCDIIGLQEVRRDGQRSFTAAGYVVFCGSRRRKAREEGEPRGRLSSWRVYCGRDG